MRHLTTKYFSWLVCSGALFAAPNLLSVTNHVRAYYVPWLDAFATWAFLFGPVILLASGAGSVLLMLLETVAERRHTPWFGRVPRLVTVTVFLMAWLRLLLGALKVNRVDIAWSDPPFELATSVGIAALLFVLVPARVSQWVDSTAKRLRPISRACVVGFVGFIAFLVLEPLDRGALGPIQVPTPNQKRPNVIVIVLDALTSRDMSLYGYSLPTTPRLDEVTKTWTVFTNAHTAATSTAAVLPTILTGRYPYMNAWHRYGDLARAGKGVLNLPHILQASGYETIYAMGGGYAPSAYHLHTSFDQILGGGLGAFNHPQHAVHTFAGRDLVNRTRWNPAIAEALLPTLSGPFAAVRKRYDEPMYDRVTQLLQKRAAASSRQPFFAYLHLWRPHQPYLGNEFLGRFLPLDSGLTDRLSQDLFGGRHYQPDGQPMVNRLRLRYDENILKVDQEIGALIDNLKRLNLYDESLIMITADHGNNFTRGYQGYSSPEMWAAEHQIPLLVKVPGQTVGRRIDTAVSLVDIAPTVLDVIGATHPREWLDGQSLLEAELAPARGVYVTRLQTDARFDFDTVAVIRGNVKLLRRKGEALLFNLADDPEERANLLGRVPAADLHAALDQFMRRGAFVREGGAIAEAPALMTARESGGVRGFGRHVAMPRQPI